MEKLIKQTTTGEKIRQLITASGIKQIVLCRGIGVSPLRLSNYLSDSREPDLSTLSDIANFLGVGLCAFDKRNNMGHEEKCPHCGSIHWVQNVEKKEKLAAVANG